MATTSFKIFGREPALVIAFVASLVTALGTLNIDNLSMTQAALIVVVVNAIGGVITALTTRPVAPSAFTYLSSSVFALLAGYGLEFSTETVGAVNAVIVTLLALITRGNITPEETKLSRA